MNVFTTAAAPATIGTHEKRPRVAPTTGGMAPGNEVLMQPKSTCRPYPQRATTPWQERFWRYVKPGPADECWEWTGSRNEHGYGRLQRGSRGEGQIKAHRASFEIHNGTIPEGLHVCHRCDNPPCVNPAHLFLGTMTENLRDAATKGRTGPQRGTSGKRKLSDQDVRDLREMAAAGVPYAEVARLVGVTPAHVSAVALGRARSDVGGPITQRYQKRSTR